MSNLMDYLDWRGDLPLTVSPFNEVDALILAELSFVDFDGIVPPPELGRGLPLNEAIRKVTEKTANQFHADVAALGNGKIGKSLPSFSLI